jgi:hypothetical protein
VIGESSGEVLATWGVTGAWEYLRTVHGPTNQAPRSGDSSSTVSGFSGAKLFAVKRAVNQRLYPANK